MITHILPEADVARMKEYAENNRIPFKYLSKIYLIPDFDDLYGIEYKGYTITYYQTDFGQGKYGEWFTMKIRDGVNRGTVYNPENLIALYAFAFELRLDDQDCSLATFSFNGVPNYACAIGRTPKINEG